MLQSLLSFGFNMAEQIVSQIADSDPSLHATEDEDVFIPCDVCDTMVRFSDYASHGRSCLGLERNRQMRARRLVFLPNVHQRHTEEQQSGEEEEGEEDDDADGEGQERGRTDRHIDITLPPGAAVNSNGSLATWLSSVLPVVMAAPRRRARGGTLIGDGTENIEETNLVRIVRSRLQQDTGNDVRDEEEDDNRVGDDDVGATENDANTDSTPAPRRPRAIISLSSTLNHSSSLTEFMMPLLQIPIIDDYQLNTLLGDLIGNVEVGVSNIDNVSSKMPISDCENGTVCPICQDAINTPESRNEVYRKTVCGHSFCDTCISKWLESSKKCPMCMCDLEEVAA